MRLIPICNPKILEDNGIYYKPSTLRKWHHLGFNISIFLKVGSRVMLDLDEWQKLVQEADAKRSKRIKQMTALLH